MNRKRMALLFFMTIVATILLVWFLQWIEFDTRFPPEHVVVEAVSPDGGKIALFSIKYQGTISWYPIDIEPWCYITIVDTQHGQVLLRETEYHGELKDTFAELAKKYAPWAIEQVTLGPWGD